MKQAAIGVLSSWPARMLVRGCLRVVGAVTRFAGQARFRALVPTAGRRSTCHWGAVIKFPENLTVGDHVRIGENVVIGAGSPIILEDHVRISQRVVIETSGADFSGQPPYPHVSRPITIRRGAWLATNCVILGGVTIGEYSVIGAGVTVSHDVPPYTIVAAPAPRQARLRSHPQLRAVQ